MNRDVWAGTAAAAWVTWLLILVVATIALHIQADPAEEYVGTVLFGYLWGSVYVAAALLRR